MRRVLIGLLLALPCFAEPRGFGESASGNNKALLVGVAQGLPGLGIDIDNMKRILAHETNNFEVTSVLRDKDAPVANIAKYLTQGASAVDSRGSFLFYFTGHGAKNVILAQDRTMQISEIRKALEDGRKDWGPMRRLVLFFDSCHSGSLLDPVYHFPFAFFDESLWQTKLFVDALEEEFSPRKNRDTYWSELFILASALASETCEASGQGSAFTNALTKAFDATVKSGTIADFIAKTKQGTSGSHPIERLVPPSLGALKL